MHQAYAINMGVQILKNDIRGYLYTSMLLIHFHSEMAYLHMNDRILMNVCTIRREFYFLHDLCMQTSMW